MAGARHRWAPLPRLVKPPSGCFYDDEPQYYCQACGGYMDKPRRHMYRCGYDADEGDGWDAAHLRDHEERCGIARGRRRPMPW